MKHITKHITKLGVVALVAALTASASAFPYSVSQRFSAPSQAANSPTIGVSVHGRGVGQNMKGASRKEIVEPVASRKSSPRGR